MKRKIYLVLEVIFTSICCFLLYFIGSLLLDHLLDIEFLLKNTLISSTGFALLWACISAYKIAKNGYYLRRPRKNNTPQQEKL